MLPPSQGEKVTVTVKVKLGQEWLRWTGVGGAYVLLGGEGQKKVWVSPAFFRVGGKE